MKLKSLVLGAAGLFAVTGAQAADLPPAPHPVDYVRICDAFGSGFFYIPGTDSCLRLRGRLRTEVRYRHQDGDQPVRLGIASAGIRSQSPLFFRARGYWGWDHRTNTDIGLVRAFFRGFIDRDTGDGGGVSLHMDYAFIQIGGLTVGFSDLIIEPVYLTYGLIHHFDLPGMDEESIIAQYVYSFGNGFSIGGVIFDGSTGSFGSSMRSAVAGANTYGGLRIPSAGASLTYDGSIGSFRLAGLVQDVYVGALTGSDHTVGWGVGGSADVGIPFGTNTRFGINAQYADGIVTWLHNDLNNFFPDFTVNPLTGSTDKSKGWSVGVGFTTQVYDRTTFAIGGGYTSVESDNTSAAFLGIDEVRFWDLQASLQYQLTSNLVISTEAQYRDMDFGVAPGFASVNSSDGFSTLLRAQLDF